MQLSEQIMQTLLERYPVLAEAKNYQGKWSYDFGVVLKGVLDRYDQTKNPAYRDYVKQNMDYFIQEDGEIKGYRFEAMNIDYVNNGKILFSLYEDTKEEKYKKAMERLFNQLKEMPRTSEGGFWHKKIYPYQMWLDGLYMGAPFYAEYLMTFCEGEGIEDVIKQFELCYKHTLDEETGLLYHAWDEKRQQEWADPETGLSPHFWGRSMGWYVMALVDTIQILPETHAGRTVLAEQLISLMEALKKVQDPTTKVWYQILDKGEERGNYLEASATSMIVAAAAKGYQLGVLGEEWLPFIQESYVGLQEEFVFYTKENWVNLARCCEVAGLGGDDKRDGTFVYYISEPIITNDFKGYGAFLQAAVRVEQL
ncbi:glycoside hydrolase family 88/105 protein [Jeotgalibaca caeni]|uniref:glycoside hydrolase family 88/105 protein n=1 Tax=Jeotgalibaca caeni TaxID=3028623 RepID=UPI00237D9AE3|nr:glycoside hydrolase family 88 protein [Jeotgalibaca caeni]MDE1549429.1 glycoside hydrolase family 88 protein [Jeotgalibaca caeni]